MNIMIGGSISAVSSPSTLRSDRRSARLVSVCRSFRVRTESVIGGLAFGGRHGGAGEGEEDVVEAGAGQLEAVDQDSVGIELVEPGADRAGLPVTGHAETQGRWFGGNGQLARSCRQVRVRVRVRRD